MEYGVVLTGLRREKRRSGPWTECRRGGRLAEDLLIMSSRDMWMRSAIVVGKWERRVCERERERDCSSECSTEWEEWVSEWVCVHVRRRERGLWLVIVVGCDGMYCAVNTTPNHVLTRVTHIGLVVVSSWATLRTDYYETVNNPIAPFSSFFHKRQQRINNYFGIWECQAVSI